MLKLKDSYIQIIKARIDNYLDVFSYISYIFSLDLYERKTHIIFRSA